MSLIMISKKRVLRKKSLRQVKSITGLPSDALELEIFISTLDLSGDLSRLLAKPLKKSA
ncbi:unannotated protein [freshwater metagenome]|uniref:Unannotated protein n=1 Tax=freshwater metagenome TaxID=449393 RepID=A0A6J7IKD1_9ZZZZ